MPMPIAFPRKSLIFLNVYFVLQSFAESSKLTLQDTTQSENGKVLTYSSADIHGKSQRGSSLCGQDQIFHNETQRCYYPSNSRFAFTHPENVTTPCGKLMYLYQVSSDSPSYGVCDCVTDDGCVYHVDFHRPVLNWPGSNNCYYAYDQGPCKSGEWIVMNRKTFQSECQKNPCAGRPLEKISPELLSASSHANIDIFWFARNGTCYQTFTKAYCKHDEYVRFLRTYPAPLCVPVGSGFGCGSVGTTARLPCPQGYKRVGDDCSPVADFQ